MVTVKKILKKMMWTVLGIIGAFIVAVVLFANLSPQFGQAPNKEDRQRFLSSANYEDGAFTNLGGVQMDMGLKDYITSLREFISPPALTVPKKTVTAHKTNPKKRAGQGEGTRLTWLGHSAFLLQTANRNVLLDPMLGPVPAPLNWLGPKRFSELPFAIADLPEIDAVILSHDHYDHLDYGSIMQLKNRVKKFVVPLGVGSHLVEWGVSKDAIHEMDWWDVFSVSGLELVCAPAQHFSGRGFTDRGKTLWSSWVINTDKERIYFSGDSGYGPHFKEIGEKYGPFDLAMMECGQYNELWQEIHMLPEETVQAAKDIGAKMAMPVHWGSFKLATHPWTEPVERFTKRAGELMVPVMVPRIGEPIDLSMPGEQDAQDWWSAFN